MTVGTLLAVLSLLTGRAGTVGTSDVFLLLGLGLHLAIILRLVTSASEVDAVLEDMLKIIHCALIINGGRGVRL